VAISTAGSIFHAGAVLQPGVCDVSKCVDAP
jgi:hypothetical protein